MAQVTFQEFQPNSKTITAYLERANNYFVANGVGVNRQVAVLLSEIGTKHYMLLRSLTAPQLPHEKSFDDLASVLQSHFQLKPMLIAERFHFHRRDQVPDESIAEYVAELCRLSTHCKFSAQLNDALRGLSRVRDAPC